MIQRGALNKRLGGGLLSVGDLVELSLDGHPLSDPVKDAPHVCVVEVDVLREVGADVGVGVHQGAVQGGPSNADHHGDHTQQQQDQARISAYIICVT